MLKKIVLLNDSFHLNPDIRKKTEICKNGEDALYITENAQIATELIRNNKAVLLCSTEEKFFDGIPFVAYDMGDCDYEYLNMVYCRQKKEPITIFETDRTIVREMTVDDLPEMYELYDDEEIKKYIEPLYDYEEEREFTEKYIENMYGMYGFGLWLVFDKKENSLIGRAGLSIREINGINETEMGYMFKKKYRNKGYASEVCKAIINYAFYELKKEDLYIVTEKRNLPSCEFAEKLGFKILTQTALKNGCVYMIFHLSKD